MSDVIIYQHILGKLLILLVHVRWEKNMSGSPFSLNAFLDLN